MLGTISGNFIYNALYGLTNMQTFYYEAECLAVSYNVSVGLEPLEKIAVILLEHNDAVSQQAFERTAGVLFKRNVIINF